MALEKQVWHFLGLALWSAAHFLSHLVFSLFVAPFLLLGRKRENPWVMGGHRGRLYDDNCGSLHAYLRENTGQRVIWITSNREILRRFRGEGTPVLKRQSWRAKAAILRAPVLIYSHGEDDLDLFLLTWRKILGTRFHLNHCLNLLKAGDCYRRDYESFGPLRKAWFRFLITDFDWLLAGSERERANFRLSLPHRKDRILLGGGAHLDFYFRRRAKEPENTWLWFPTYRDSASGQRALDIMVRRVASDDGINRHLEDNNRQLIICHHVNRAFRSSTSGFRRVLFSGPQNLKDHLSRCSLLITDYSSLSFNALALDLPVIFFPFDLDEYLVRRRLYCDYHDFAFGPVVRSFEALKELLLVEKGFHIDTFQPRRQKWKREIFPLTTPEYALKTYQTILERTP